MSFIIFLSVYKITKNGYRPGVVQRVGRCIALLFHDRGTRRGWVVSSTPRPHFTPGKTRYPFYRKLCGSQGRSGRAGNLVPTGIRSRTVQPIAQSLYRLSYRAHIQNKYLDLTAQVICLRTIICFTRSCMNIKIMNKKLSILSRWLIIHIAAYWDMRLCDLVSA